MDEPSMKKGLAELIGTLALVYVGVLVISVSGGDLVAVALAHGLAIACMVSALMTISGAQFNPAVTVGLLVARKITPMQAGINVAAQMLGGLVGGYLAMASLPEGTAFAGVPDLGPGIGMHYDNALVYFVGPLAGAIAAALVYGLVFFQPDRPHPEPQAQMRAKGNP